MVGFICFRVFLANVSYFKDKGRYLLEFKIRLRYGRYLLANVSYFEIMLEYSLLCMKIGAVLESADNSVRKDKGRYFRCEIKIRERYGRYYCGLEYLA